jgi:hypothetical protein
VNNFSDATLYSGLYYRRTTGVTESINTVIEGVTYTQPQNLAERNSIGIENNYSHAAFSLPPKPQVESHD